MPPSIAVVVRLTVYVPGVVIHAASPLPGGWLSDQLAATFQLPFPPFQLLHGSAMAGAAPRTARATPSTAAARKVLSPKRTMHGGCATSVEERRETLDAIRRLPYLAIGGQSRRTKAMGQLAARDLRSVLDFVLEARSFPDVDSFRTGILPGLLGLVPADVVGYNEIDAVDGSTVVLSHPADTFFDGVEERFAGVVHQHPVVARAQAGDRGTYTLSDFLTERGYHRLELYQDMYRHIDAEDQIAFALPGEAIVGIALNRPRRSFSERDRELLELLRPHLSQAYSQTRERQLASTLLAAVETAYGEAGGAVLVLDAAGAIGYAAGAARDLLGGYFGTTFASDSHLPGIVADWLDTHESGARSEPLVVHGARGHLRIRHLPHPAGKAGPALLLLEEQRPGPPTAAALERLGLTRRQAEVLRLVAIGSDDAYISKQLFIAPRTVRKHLENIYARLGVSTRTAAAARAHAAASP